MLTKEQKKAHVALATEKIKASKSILFVDFSGVTTHELETLKNDLRAQGATVKIFKKRLLRISLKEAGIDYDPMTNDAQLAGIFSPNEISEIAGPVYKYGLLLKKTNAKANLEVLNAYDGEINKVLSKEEFVVIAKLPSKDVLLAQIMGGITGPLRAFMSIVKQLSEKKDEAKDNKTEEVAGGAEIKELKVEEVTAPKETTPDKTEEVSGEEKIENDKPKETEKVD